MFSGGVLLAMYSNERRQPVRALATLGMPPTKEAAVVEFIRGDRGWLSPGIAARRLFKRWIGTSGWHAENVPEPISAPIVRYPGRFVRRSGEPG